jgi:Flp pilus assembly protein TadG
MTRTRHRIKREDGVAAVEFALILPVLFLILFGVLEFGRVWSQYQLFQGAAREGARCAAVASSSTCVVQTRINQASQPYTASPAASQQIIDSAGNPISGGTRPNGCLVTDKGKDIRVSWPQQLTVDIPFWNNMTITTTMKAVFRCE